MIRHQPIERYAMARHRFLQIILALTILVPRAGCASHRIAIAEKFGYAKREQLVDRVQDARAISSLQQNADQIQSDVARLVREMEASIKEANEFIEQMQAAK